MHRLTFAALVLFVLVAAAYADEPVHLVFENQTGQQIVRLYEECHGVTDCDWDDLLGDAVLDAGASVRFAANTPGMIGGCDRAYRAELKDGRSVRLQHVDSCRAAHLVLRLP